MSTPKITWDHDAGMYLAEDPETGVCSCGTNAEVAVKSLVSLVKQYKAGLEEGVVRE